jgi:hypothetical protein
MGNNNYKIIKVLGRASTSSKNIQYFVNSNKTSLITYNSCLNKIVKTNSGEWSSTKINCEVLVKDRDGNKETIPSAQVSIKELVSDEVDFITVVSTISSTIKPMGYFTEIDPVSDIEKHIFNEFLGSTYFLKAENNNKYSAKQNIIKLLKSETPLFYILLKNLFFNESDAVVENFLNWLSKCAYKDKNQDIIFLFFGTNEINQGQGAGKGVLRDFLSELLSNLVATVSNSTYNSNFNSDLLNKKVIIYDEVDFKKFLYDMIKDITGSSTMRIEFKGKDAVANPNVSSWLMFTNQHDLQGKISYEDRRTFLIRPNPRNGSLERIMNKKHGEFSKFNAILLTEMPNLIHILALCTHNKVLSPLNLPTNAKLDYFKALNAVNVIDIKSLEKLLTDKKINKKVCDILKQNNIEKCNIIINLLKKDCINYKSFSILFNILKSNGFISNLKCLSAWERLKEHSIRNDFHIIKIEFNQTKTYKKYIDNAVLVKVKTSKTNLKILRSEVRTYFGTPIN